MPDKTAAATFKDNMLTAAQALWPTGVQVSFGHPGPSQSPNIVALLAVSSEQEPATYGTARSREETLTLTVMFSIYRAGGSEMEKVASDYAYQLLGDLERQVRMTDTTVGGAVRECFLVSHRSEGATDPETLASGRLIEVEAVFQAKARVRS